MPDKKTFIDELLAGRALITDFKEWQLKWHKFKAKNPDVDLPVYEFLGFTKSEYAAVFGRPQIIKAIVHARKIGEPFDAEAAEENVMVAVSSRESEDALLLLEELRSNNWSI